MTELELRSIFASNYPYQDREKSAKDYACAMPVLWSIRMLESGNPGYFYLANPGALVTWVDITMGELGK